MPGLYSHTTRAIGTTLTAAIYNADHENHITNLVPDKIDDASANVTAMQAQTDPGEDGSESLPLNLDEELQRLRFTIAEMKGQTYWYESAFGSLSDPSSNHLLYNTSFSIWQEGISRTDAASSVVQMDGWSYYRVGAARCTVSQSSTVPTVAQAGAYIPYSLLTTVTTADAAIAASDYVYIGQRIEGLYALPIVQRQFTLSFWVRSAVAGTYCVAFRNGGFDRSFVAEYTISSANTWEYKTITVDASPTAGTWSYTADTIGFDIVWALMAGTDTQAGAAGTWTTGNYTTTNNQVNAVETVGNTFYLAAPKITPGPTASRWLCLPFQAELARCQRYLESSWPIGTNIGTAFTAGTSGHGAYIQGPSAAIAGNAYFKANKCDPTGGAITLYDAAGTSGAVSYYDGAWKNGGGVLTSGKCDSSFWVSVNTAATIVTHFQWVSDARL